MYDVISNTAEIFLSPDEIPRWRRRSRRFSSFQITHAAMIWQLSAKKNFFSSKKVISFCLKRENFGPRFPFNPHPDLIAERYNLTLPPFSGHRKMATWVWMHKPRDSSFKKFLQFIVQWVKYIRLHNSTVVCTVHHKAAQYIQHTVYAKIFKKYSKVIQNLSWSDKFLSYFVNKLLQR